MLAHQVIANDTGITNEVQQVTVSHIEQANIFGAMVDTLEQLDQTQIVFMLIKYKQDAEDYRFYDTHIRATMRDCIEFALMEMHNLQPVEAKAILTWS